jgi:hypothetical protein
MERSMIDARITARLGGMAGLVAAALLGGCAPARIESSSWWVPAARARFVTLGRSTNYAIVHADGRDLLIVEDPLVREPGKEMVGRLTWLVALPSGAAMDRAIEVGGAGPEAWLLEQLAGEKGHAVKATGTVWVHARTADRLDASLHLRALGREPTAGVPQHPTIELDRKYSFVRHAPGTPQYQEMNTRNGMMQRTVSSAP